MRSIVGQLLIVGGIITMAAGLGQAQEDYEISAGIVARVSEGICGAIARDAFDGQGMNTNLWSFWNSNPGIEVEVKDGYCRIHGEPRESGSAGAGFNGLVSPRFWETDATFVVEMMAPSAAEHANPGYFAHFCGSIPDRYPEIILLGEPGKLRWHFNAVQEGNGWYSDPNDAPVQGNPTTEWTEVKVRHNGLTEMSSVAFKGKDGWVQVGKEYVCITNVSRAELKFWCGTENLGKPHDLRFRNFRMYADPARHPVKFMVIDGDLWSARNMDVTLWTADHQKVAARGTTDDFGRVYLSLAEAPWEAYPASCIVEVSRDGTVLGQARIESSGVAGLYPRNTYLVRVTTDESAR